MKISQFLSGWVSAFGGVVWTDTFFELNGEFFEIGLCHGGALKWRFARQKTIESYATDKQQPQHKTANAASCSAANVVR
jgi:hypothetical protein